jgi:UPF0755 protein
MKSKPLSIFYLLFCFFLWDCGNKTLNEEKVLFEIKKGDSIHIVSEHLKSENIIRSPFNFKLLAKLKGKDSKLKFGVYQIKENASYAELIDLFTSGQIYSVKVTIPEGFNIFQIADLLSQEGLVKKEVFLNETIHPSIYIGEFPSIKNLEGCLYPDTYLIPYNYNAGQIIELMVENFRKNVSRETLNQIKSKGLNLNKILIMASIVEKEARLESEKPIIAGVYYNRLKKGMKLQADPTLIYALILSGRYDGEIRFRDFPLDSPYNTYKCYGLPPGPIANPSKSSILAAIHPKNVEFYYFVAKQDGTHYFSKTLQEHNQAVYQYQKLPAIEKRRKKKESS